MYCPVNQHRIKAKEKKVVSGYASNIFKVGLNNIY